MKGVYVKEPNSITYSEMPSPEKKPGHAIIKVKAAGVCGSDLTAYRGSNPTINYPLTLGHELAGEIIWVDPQETEFKVGDRVTVEPYLHCGTCYACRRGIFNNCENLQVYGSHINGGMTDEFSVPVSYLHKIPDDMSFVHATLVEPLTISLHGLHRGKVKSGDFVVITGAGTIGLLAAMSVLAYGATPIIMDIVQSRLDFAKAHGIPYTLNSLKEDCPAEIRRITNGQMADVMLECSGAASALKSIPDYVANGANVVMVGWAKGPVELDVVRFMKKELNIFGSRCSLNAFPEAIKLIHEKRVDAPALISDIVHVSKIADLFKTVCENPDKYLKVICEFD